eukprot:4917124-Amphidinium_carterae.1
MIIWTKVCPSKIAWRTSSQVILYQEPLRRKPPSTMSFRLDSIPASLLRAELGWPAGTAKVTLLRTRGTLRKQECKPKAKKKDPDHQ